MRELAIDLFLLPPGSVLALLGVLCGTVGPEPDRHVQHFRKSWHVRHRLPPNLLTRRGIAARATILAGADRSDKE
jgi:hypothetical protein